MNLFLVKSMVRGGIQTILPCLLTNSDSTQEKIELDYDAEIDYFTAVKS